MFVSLNANNPIGAQEHQSAQKMHKPPNGFANRLESDALYSNIMEKNRKEMKNFESIRQEN